MDKSINSSRLPFDIRAEVFARLLAKRYDLSIEQLLFEPSHFYQRWGRRDVLEVSDEFSFNLDKKRFRLAISREGIYDVLPDSIFLHPEDPYPDEKAKSKALTQQEVDARKLLFPFEQLFYWQGLENELDEYHFENELEDWWQTLMSGSVSSIQHQLLTDRQQEILTFLLPHLSDIVGDFLLTGQWLSMILETTIEIEEMSPKDYSLPLTVQKRMGEGVLGENFVIGGVFSDGMSHLLIDIQKLSPEIVGNFVEGGKQRIILEDVLLPLFLPIEFPFEVSLNLSTESPDFQIGENYQNSILGFTTVLENL